MGKWYVSMTDKIFSSWGKAENKVSKFVVVCDTIEQALEVHKNAALSPEMRYVKLGSTKPRFSKAKYHTVFKDYSECTRFHDYHEPEPVVEEVPQSEGVKRLAVELGRILLPRY